MLGTIMISIPPIAPSQSPCITYLSIALATYLERIGRILGIPVSYMAIIHHVRKKAGKQNSTIYGISTDSRDFHLESITSLSHVSYSGQV